MISTIFDLKCLLQGLALCRFYFHDYLFVVSVSYQGHMNHRLFQRFLNPFSAIAYQKKIHRADIDGLSAQLNVIFIPNRKEAK